MNVLSHKVIPSTLVSIRIKFRLWHETVSAQYIGELYRGQPHGKGQATVSDYSNGTSLGIQGIFKNGRLDGQVTIVVTERDQDHIVSYKSGLYCPKSHTLKGLTLVAVPDEADTDTLTYCITIGHRKILLQPDRPHKSSLVGRYIQIQNPALIISHRNSSSRKDGITIKVPLAEVLFNKATFLPTPDLHQLFDQLDFESALRYAQHVYDTLQDKPVSDTTILDLLHNRYAIELHRDTEHLRPEGCLISIIHNLSLLYTKPLEHFQGTDTVQSLHEDFNPIFRKIGLQLNPESSFSDLNELLSHMKDLIKDFLSHEISRDALFLIAMKGNSHSSGMTPHTKSLWDSIYKH